MSFNVGEDCPYYKTHKVAEIKYNSDGEVELILGPHNEPYTMHEEFDADFKFDPDTCKEQFPTDEELIAHANDLLAKAKEEQERIAKELE